jgi:hypothetical protein
VETANYEPNAKLVDNGREIGIEEEAERHLELVAINRVFDVEGLWEVLSEVGRDSNSGGSHDELGGKRDDGQVVGDGHANEGAEPGLQPEIIDSEEEDIDLSDPQRTSNQQQLPAATTLHLTKTKSTEQEDSEDEGTEIVIIDNMTNLINELFSRKERNEGAYPPLLPLGPHTIPKLTEIHSTCPLEPSLPHNP